MFAFWQTNFLLLPCVTEGAATCLNSIYGGEIILTNSISTHGVKHDLGIGLIWGPKLKGHS